MVITIRSGVGKSKKNSIVSEMERKDRKLYVR